MLNLGPVRMAYLDPSAGAAREGAQAATVAAVATANADATYGQPEADLINELKTQFNALRTSLRNAGIVA